MNNHYVPQLTLRRFGDRICTYNIKSGQYSENVRTEHAFCEKDMYSDDVENNLNRKIESQFGSLFSNKLNKASDTLELSRHELLTVKKFLLISVLRSAGSESFIHNERNYYKRLQERIYKYALQMGASEEEARRESQQKQFNPFEEVVITGETDFDYWMRTLNVVLETDGTPQGILSHPKKTYPAYRWAEVINNGYVAFWDSEYDHDEFLITDIGMTSENEVGWNGITVHNHKKTELLHRLLLQEKNNEMRKNIANNLQMLHCLTENFMMFPISAKRMIVEINPFFKFRKQVEHIYSMPPLSYLTVLANEKLFYPNKCRYVLPQNSQGFTYHPDDRYIYEIKKLTSDETQYCNALFLDRIDTLCGFSSLEKAVGSIKKYKKLNKPPFMPRNDYSDLYKIVAEHFNE